MTPSERGQGDNTSLVARFALTLPLLGLATLVACVIWCVVYAGYVGYIRDGRASEIGIDLSLLVFALIKSLDKVGAPIAQLIFSNWLVNNPRVDVIAGGMLCGTAFGAVGGVYLIAWSVERAFRSSPQGAAVKDTLRWISIAYLMLSSFMIGLGSWNAPKLVNFLSDWETLGIVLVAGLLSGLGVLCVYAALSWLAYWGTMIGHRLWGSIRKFQ
jgi:hypothetical protein